MNRPDRFSFDFIPVGQGLFCDGAIFNREESAPRFLWVYDCGTSSSQMLIDKGIQRLERSMGTRKRVDLLTLSHFDKDHVSGVYRVIEQFRIGTLMLPYMPLALRLIIAFAEGSGGPDDMLTDFFLNPVAYVLAAGGPGIERILFVGPSGEEGPSTPQEPARVPDQGDNPDIEFEHDKPADPDELAPLFDAVQKAGANTRVEFLRRGSAMRFSGIWEFVPYNDDPEVEIDARIQNACRTRTRSLIRLRGAQRPGRRIAGAQEALR